ncbi:MAG: hypothetical protein IPM29_04490 [Planctomycetes bacterium]|nr:hypothetical protein [Planctomycetota bacterium]
MFEPPSSALPWAFVERGGPLLRALLDRVDSQWMEATGKLARSVVHDSDPDAIRYIAASAGHSHLVELAGGATAIVQPERLCTLLLAALRGRPPRMRALLDALLGVRLVAVAIDDAPDPFGIPLRAAARVTVCTLRTATRAVVVAVVRQLLPAHVEFDDRDLIEVDVDPGADTDPETDHGTRLIAADGA